MIVDIISPGVFAFWAQIVFGLWIICFPAAAFAEWRRHQNGWSYSELPKVYQWMLLPSSIMTVALILFIIVPGILLGGVDQHGLYTLQE